MWIVCITSVRHVLTVNGYGGRQTKENEKSWCFKGWETLVIKITHNSRYSFKYTWFFIEFIRCLLEYEDKEQALQQAEQRCDVEVNRQNLCNGSFVVDTVESVVNWFMAGNSYKECVFSAINSGKSSDAVGALTGLLAGIYYGLELKNGVKGFETMESYIDSFIQYLNPTL